MVVEPYLSQICVSAWAVPAAVTATTEAASSRPAVPRARSGRVMVLLVLGGSARLGAFPVTRKLRQVMAPRLSRKERHKVGERRICVFIHVDARFGPV